MLKETVELTLSHVDLGTLGEQAAMTLVGNTFVHRLLEGKGHTLSEVKDANGHVAYPGFFMTHLSVPPAHLLEKHRVWEKVGVGIEVTSFGGMIVESTFVLGAPNEIPEEIDQLEEGTLPMVRAANMFVLEDSRGNEPQPSVPKRDCIADLPKRTTPPAAVARFGQVQIQGRVDPDFRPTMSARAPVRYPIVEGRDSAAGHALLFSSFVRIMDHALRTLLCEQAPTPVPVELVLCLAALERETWYLNNTYGDQVVLAKVGAKLEPCPRDLLAKDSGKVAAGILSCCTELYEESTNKLLIASKARQVFAVPATRKTLQKDVERLLANQSSV
ncbi:MAG: hypothetical protein HY903_14350 [Deltaproteobacteria bacterium]|nr:hypothetical protein [Deltaproteobacteria bacterium]